jgi:hypothetical protein
MTRKGKESLGRDDKGRENRFKAGKRKRKSKKNSVSLYLCVLNKKQKNENSNCWWRSGWVLSSDKPERNVPGDASNNLREIEESTC